MVELTSGDSEGTPNNRVSPSQSVPHASYEFLLDLRARGVEVRSDGNALRVTAQPGVIDDEVRRSIAARKEELLAFLGQRAAHDLTQQRVAQAEQTHRGAKLSPAQRRLWLLDRLQPDSTAYSLPYALQLTGEVDHGALEASFRALLDRHDALRTRIVEVGSDALAISDDARWFELGRRELPSERELAAELARQATKPFALTRDPLLRAVLYRTGGRHVLFLNLHHIICDGWSIELLLDELFAGYEALRQGRQPDSTPLPTSFEECAREELARTADPRFERELAHAVARLRDAEPLALPTDVPRPPVFDTRGDMVPFTLDGRLSANLKQLATRCATTPYVVLQAAYALLLARYSGQLDVVVGSPIAGRDRSASERVIGFFARTLVVRTQLDLSESFAALVERVKQGCLAAFEDQHVPFEQLVEALNPARDRSRTPLFQVLFSLQETRDRSGDATAAFHKLPLSCGGAKADLTLLLEHDGARFHGKLEYASSLFERATIERMARNYETLLAGALDDPSTVIGKLPLVHADELAALARMHGEQRKVPAVGGFHALIRAQARRTPDNIAVVDAHGEATYRELDERSDAWASLLAKRGVGRGARVGLALTRTRRVLEVAIGVLKAGAAYVPLDTSFPRERLAHMASDSGVQCIVAERATRAGLPDGFTVLLADEPPPSAPAPEVESQPSDIAYIIYTSGSTGQPKGVEVQHGGVINLLTSMAERPGCSEEDRVLAVSTFSFDMCIAELYLPLVVGARTILAPRTCAADGATLARYIDEYGATLVQATPTSFKLLVEAGLPRQRFKAIGGGEAFPAQLARELEPVCDEVWNGYGPTETTVYATFHRIVRERPVLIGKALANTRLYVLDGFGQPVPFGVAGELYIGGDGVSAGYRNQPELTAQRFLPDPRSERPDARMYRTGDMVCMRADGVQYLGRVDHQVKLRGYRIELGEIESVLARHPAVKQCAVVVRELAEDDQRLVAYLSCTEEAEPTRVRELLREHLAKRLPGYMVPRLMVVLSALPMTASGKVDRKRLPDPRAYVAEAQPSQAAPRDATERALHEIWQRVLGSAEIGPEDDFFAAGGHSLLAVKLVHEINAALHTSLPLSVVFDAPTIRAQAQRIDRGDYVGGVSVVPLARGSAKPPLFCVCGINLYQELARELDDDRPVYGLLLPVEGELFRDAAIELDAREMARQYLEAIRSVQPHGPYHLTGISFGGLLAYEIAVQLRAQGERVALLALLEVILPQAGGTSRLLRTLHRARGRGRSALRRLLRVPRALVAPLWRDTNEPTLPPTDPDELGLEAMMDRRMERYHGALARYAATMPLYDGDAVLVRGLDQVRAMPGCADDYGWGRYVRGELTRFDLPGDHLGILIEPHVSELARRLRARLGAHRA